MENYKKFIFEKYEREYVEEILSEISEKSEMQDGHKYFLNGLVRKIRPEKVLEVGVSAGGSSAILLNSIKDNPNAKLISVEYSEPYYKDSSKKSGFLIDESFPQLKKQWTLYAGGDVSKFIREIGGDIDFVLLDTVHSHPWETLNFLTILPYLKKGAWVVLHDISLFISGSDAFACKYLFDYVTSENKVRPLTEKDRNIFPNVGAFQVTDDTHKYVEDVFMSLALPWKNGVQQVSKPDLEQIINVLEEHYSAELIDILKKSIEAQDIYIDNLAKRPLLEKIKNIAKIIAPVLYYKIYYRSRNQ